MTKRTGAAAAAILAAALGGSSCSGSGGGTAVTLLGYTASAPSSWQARPAANAMRLAEYTLPASTGAEPAELVVYYFGAGQGGSADANIARWTAQFVAPDGGPVRPAVSQLEGTMYVTTVAEFEGSYGRGMGMGPGRDEAKPDQALSAAIVETPLGNLFVQLFGPRAEVQAARADFVAFVRSIRG
jgi:hypothetical protein